MDKLQSRSSKLIVSIVMFLLLLPATVFAWFVFYRSLPIVTVETGEISVNSNLFGNALINGVKLENLMYVDYDDDIVANKTGTLNVIASSVFVRVIVGEDSIPVTTDISFVFPIDQPSLHYLIIFEGVNILPVDYTTDYYSIILGMTPVGGLSQYNIETINTISETVLMPDDELIIQVVFWGDISAVALEDYLTTTYSMQIQLNIKQAKRG